MATNANVNALSRQLQEMLLADAMAKAQGFAIPYKALCSELSAISRAMAERAEQGRKDRLNLWDTFKKALAIAANSGHSVESMRLGLELACNEAQIPGGSFRSYVNTLGQLYNDVLRGELKIEEAIGLSIGDARARYRVVSPAAKLRQELVEVTRDWTPDELAALINLARTGAVDDDDLIETIANAAEAHNDDTSDERERAAA